MPPGHASGHRKHADGHGDRLVIWRAGWADIDLPAHGTGTPFRVRRAVPGALGLGQDVPSLKGN